jgi:hypothetical protein
MIGTKKTNAGSPAPFPSNEKLPTISVRKLPDKYPAIAADAYWYFPDGSL